MLSRTINASQSTSTSIALVANSSWYIYNLRLGIIKALQKSGYQVTVIAPEDDFTTKLKEEGCSVHTIPLNNKGVNPLEDIKYCLRLLKLYRQYQFDYIFHYTIKPNIYGTLAATMGKTSATSIVSGLGYSFIKKGIINTLVKQLYRGANLLADEVWFVNPDDKHLFESQAVVKSKKTRLLPGEGVDMDYFKRNIPVQSNAQSTYRFLFCGRLIWTKGVGEYVEAAKIIKQKYPDVQFDILGYLNVENPDAIPSDTIHAWHHQGIINYLGSTEDVRPYLENTTCLVLPSYYGEGTPRSLLEAASMEVAILTTDHVGCREVVEDGYNGYLCQPRNANDLAEKMERIISMRPSKLKKMSENGRELVGRRFDEHYVIEQYLNKLQERLPEPNPVASKRPLSSSESTI